MIPRVDRAHHVFTSEEKRASRKRHMQAIRAGAPTLFDSALMTLRKGIYMFDFTGAQDSLVDSLTMYRENHFLRHDGGYIGVDEPQIVEGLDTPQPSTGITHGLKEYPEYVFKQTSYFYIEKPTEEQKKKYGGCKTRGFYDDTTLVAGYNIGIMHLDGYGEVLDLESIKSELSTIKGIARASLKENGAFVLTYTKDLDGHHLRHGDRLRKNLTASNSIRILAQAVCDVFGGIRPNREFSMDDLLPPPDVMALIDRDRQWTGVSGAFDIYHSTPSHRMVVVRIILT